MAVFGRKIRMRFESLSPDPDGAFPYTVPDSMNIGFTVERTLKKEPSTLTATIYNLSADTRERLQKQSNLIVTLEAGYQENFHSIFVGDVRIVRQRREPPLLAVDIEAGDGYKGSKIWARKFFAKGTSVDSVFRYLATKSGVGPGNVDRAAQIREDNGLPDRLENGITVRGYAHEEFAALAKSRGIEWSIQDNEVQALKYGKGKEGVPVTTVSSGASAEYPEPTGLIGYPTVDNKGTLVFNHRLLPNVFPGSLLNVQTEFVKGRYRVLRALYSGSLWGSDFNIEVEGEAA